MVTRDKAPNIEVTKEMKEKAKAFADRVVKETYDRFKYDLKVRNYKIYLGKLGEEVLYYFFLKYGIQSQIDYNIYPGTSSIDKTDLVINGHRVDSKVGTQPFHKRLLVVKSYFDKGHKSDFYVAINFYDNENVAVIYGYATQNEIQNAPVERWDPINPVDDYTLLYDHLKPIERLMEIIVQKKIA